MNTSVRAPGYDVFKLITAITLLILFLFLLRRGSSQTPIPRISPIPSTGIASTTPTIVAPSQESATVVPGFSPTPTLIALPSSTPSSTPIPSPLPAPTTKIAPTTSATAETPSNTTACEAATSRSHLQVGRNATIVRRLNFRSSPGIQNNWLLTNTPGTKVEVIGGPVCLSYSMGAYVWWEIKLPDGRTGWSAEASQRGSFYFMEPTP